MNKFTRTVHSFAELGDIMGVKPKQSKEPCKKVCKKCGAFMDRVPGTNIWVCHGTLKEKNDAGEVIRERPCTNFVLERTTDPIPVAHPA